MGNYFLGLVSNHASSPIPSKLIAAAKQARQADTNSLKKALPKLLPDDVPALADPSPQNASKTKRVTDLSLENIPKTLRGFHHSVTARLLCPISKDFMNAKYVLLFSAASDSLLIISLSSDMEKLREGTEALSIGDYHHFMYEDFLGDLTDASEGLLRSYILIQVYFFCLFPAASGYLPQLGLGLQSGLLLA